MSAVALNAVRYVATYFSYTRGFLAAIASTLLYAYGTSTISRKPRDK